MTEKNKKIRQKKEKEKKNDRVAIRKRREGNRKKGRKICY